MVRRAKKAVAEFESADQERVDSIVKELAHIVFLRAEELAKMAVEESRMGGYDYKVRKNKAKARILWNDLRTKRSVGIIRRDEETGIVEVAKPVGVVGAVTPCTNPVVTPMCNAMFALKGKNAIILAPHPRVKKCVTYMTRLYREMLAARGAPEDLVQAVEEPSIEGTKELMSLVDVVVATGGMDMVKSAYSSGKPSFGVGAGNVQCIIDRGTDFKEAVSKIVDGRTFDNGIICSGEQAVMIPEESFDEIAAEFVRQGCRLVEDPAEKRRLTETLYPNGGISKDMVGRTAEEIAKAAGIEVPAGTRMILVKESREDKKAVLRREKMFPVAVAFPYGEFAEAVETVLEDLEIEGKGHSVSIHSNDEARIEYLALKAPVSRVIVNAPCSTTSGGSFFNGFAPTTTLGCGSWGNNSISENLTYKHLINITRIGYLRPDNPVPTDEELWGDGK